MKPGWTSVSTTTGFSAPRGGSGCRPRDVEVAAGLAEHVEEGQHLLLLGAADEDVAVGRERRARPRGGLVAVEDRPVVVAAQRVDALDEDHAVGLVGDDRAHLLQHRDEVHDLGLDRRVAQLGRALGAHRGQQHLLRRAHARVRQVDVRAVQAVRRGEPDAAGQLLDRRAERAQRVEVEVDRAVADAASAEVRDEGLAEQVQERAAEEDRDARRAGVRVDLLEVRRDRAARVEAQDALAVVLT
jgi:hypothetical protein